MIGVIRVISWLVIGVIGVMSWLVIGVIGFKGDTSGEITPRYDLGLVHFAWKETLVL